MAMRTSVLAVKTVLSTSLTDPQITQFIEDANLWITEELTGETGLSNERLEIIERYLACALCRLRDLGVTSAAFGDSTEKFQVDSEVTDYLLRAAALDPTGRIRETYLSTEDRTTLIAKVGTGYADA